MIYVISDIHGAYDKYKALLEKIHFSDDDTLYVLGDNIDRGPDGLKIILDMLFRPNVIGLVGNHEMMALKSLKALGVEITEETIPSLTPEVLHEYYLWVLNGGDTTIKEFLALDKEHREMVIEYMEELSVLETIDVGEQTFILVHAGLGNFSPEKKLYDYTKDELCWHRPDFNQIYFDDPKIKVIVGHTPTYLINGKMEAYVGPQIICIDCGATFENGKLCCLCLDDMSYTYIS